MNHRPVLIDLNPRHLPLPALVSILHRLSGIFILFLIPVLLFMLQESLQSEHHFEQLKMSLSHPGLKVLFWLALSALGFHLLAGIRHMLMDMHIGESKYGGKIGAVIVLMMSLALMIAFAVMGWRP